VRSSFRRAIITTVAAMRRLTERIIAIRQTGAMPAMRIPRLGKTACEDVSDATRAMHAGDIDYSDYPLLN